MTIRLRNLEEVKREDFCWGWIRWLMNDQVDPDAQQTVGVVQIDAGQRNPTHCHPNCEELLYVISGACEHALGDEVITMRQGDMIRIPAGVPHYARTVGDQPVQAIIIYSTGDRKTEMVQ